MMLAQKSWWLFCFTLKSCLMVCKKASAFPNITFISEQKNRQKPRIMSASLFLQLGQQNFLRNCQADFCLYLIVQTYVTRPGDSMETKIIETWLSLFSETAHDPLSSAGHIATLNTSKILIARKGKGCE